MSTPKLLETLRAIRARWSGPAEALDDSDLPAPDLARIVTLGSLIIAVFFGGFLSWATLAPLDSAAIAQGTVAVEGNRKTIQHLEGGIVAEILARDGDTVAPGDVLVRLDATKSRATLDLLRGRASVARALEARLLAERDGLGAISFPTSLSEAEADSQAAEIRRGQEAIFAARRDALQGQTAILAQRVSQYEEEIRGIEGQIRSETRQIKLIDEELAGMRDLFAKGLAQKSKLLSLERRAAEIEGSRSLHVAQIARARQSIGETRLRITELRTSRANEVVEELRGVRSDLYDLEERLRAAEDVLRRTEVTAPIAGKVVASKVHTPGGVVAPAAAMMDIVPSDERLIVEARIDPQDIDVVHDGLEAQVRLTAFNQRNTLPVNGRVVSVSADHLVDEANGQTYYLARIQLPETTAELQPGMPAEVMIVTGERTLLGYLLEPLFKSFGRAFRET